MLCFVLFICFVVYSTTYLFTVCVAHCPWASVLCGTIFHSASISFRFKIRMKIRFSACVKQTKREHKQSPSRTKHLKHRSKQNKDRIHVYSVLSCYLMTTTDGNETFILSYSLVYWTKRCVFFFFFFIRSISVVYIRFSSQCGFIWSVCWVYIEKFSMVVLIHKVGFESRGFRVDTKWRFFFFE